MSLALALASLALLPTAALAQGALEEARAALRAGEPERAIAVLEELEGVLRAEWRSVREQWRSRCPALGTRVRVGDVIGLAIDLDDDGALLVEAAGGTVRVTVGDVEPVRDV